MAVDEAELWRTRGRLITRLREERLLSRSALARKAGLTTSTITYAEQGESQIRFTTLRKLAEALGVDPLTLLYPDQYPHTTDKVVEPARPFDNDMRRSGQIDADEDRKRRLHAALVLRNISVYDEELEALNAAIHGHLGSQRTGEPYAIIALEGRVALERIALLACLVESAGLLEAEESAAARQIIREALSA
jgi:transcriptional regulator with XRE-family HTH domain